MVRRAQVGPAPCPIAELTVPRLADGLRFLLLPETIDKVQALAVKMQAERGVEEGVNSFHRHLPLGEMLCEVELFRKKGVLAKVYCFECGLKMCSEADSFIHRKGGYREDHTRVPFHSMKYGVARPRGVLGSVGQGVGVMAYEIAGGVYDVFAKPVKGAVNGGVSGGVQVQYDITLAKNIDETVEVPL